MTTPRNTNIELLRFVLMCFIFLWHILVHGYDLKMLGADGYQVQGSFALMAIGLTLFAPATYCFVFISGYYGIRFKLKKLITLLLWCVVVSVGAKVYQYIYQGEVFHVVDFMESLLPITSNKWWFMTDFIMLYVLSPILNEGFDRLQSKEKARILLLLCLFSFIGVALLYPNQGSSLVGLTMVYLLGRYWHTSKLGGRMSMFKSCETFLVSFALFLTSLLVMYYASQLLHRGSIAKLIFPFLGYANPLIVVMAVSLFLMVKSLPAHANNFLNRLLSANLFIYLLTETGVFVSYRQLASEFEQGLGFALVHSFIVIGLCLLAGQVIMLVTALLVEKCEKIFKFK